MRNAVFDVVKMLVLGVIGYVFVKLGDPLAPLVPGDLAVPSFPQSTIGVARAVAVLWLTPLVAALTRLALVILFWPILSQLVRVPRQTAHGRPATP